MDSPQERNENHQFIDHLSKLEVNVEGFSGPLDLLCCLVESREIELSKIKLGELVRVYGAYLSGSGKASISVISDFITAAAGLLLRKVLTLLPQQDTGEEEEGPEESVLSEEEVLRLLERYRPYRKARKILEIMKSQQERLYARETIQREDPLYDLGDLYNLASIWWNTIYRKEIRSSREEDLMLPEGIPLAVPEGVQIDNRIQEISMALQQGKEIFLKDLVSSSFSIPLLVVTILALLEMARLKQISLQQEEMFGDVIISPGPDPVTAGEKP